MWMPFVKRRRRREHFILNNCLLFVLQVLCGVLGLLLVCSLLYYIIRTGNELVPRYLFISPVILIITMVTVCVCIYISDISHIL